MNLLQSLELVFFLYIIHAATESTSDRASDKTDTWLVKSVIASNNYMLAYNTTLALIPTIVPQEVVHQSCGDSAKEMFTDTEFQLHQPNCPLHGEDDFKVSLVENAFSYKWNRYESLVKDAHSIDDLIYDEFFDYNFGLYIKDLTNAILNVQNKENEVPYCFILWSLDEEIDGRSKFISLIEYIPESQIVYELISEYVSSYDSLLENEFVFKSDVARYTFTNNNNVFNIKRNQRKHMLNILNDKIENGIERYESLEESIDDIENIEIQIDIDKNTIAYPWSNGPFVTAIKQTRCVKNLDQNVAWYKEYLSAELITTGESKINDRAFEYAHLYLPYLKGFEIVFYSYLDDYHTISNTIKDSSFDLTVGDVEKGINSVHESLTISPNCGFNRWFDNHYAINMLADENSFVDIFDKIDASKQRYIVFAAYKEQADEIALQTFNEYNVTYLFYLFVIEPNGNTIEIIGHKDDDLRAQTATVWQSTFCNKICDASSEANYLFTNDWVSSGEYTQYGTYGKYGAEASAQDNILLDKKESLYVCGLIVCVLLLFFYLIYNTHTSINNDFPKYKYINENLLSKYKNYYKNNKCEKEKLIKTYGSLESIVTDDKKQTTEVTIY